MSLFIIEQASALKKKKILFKEMFFRIKIESTRPKKKPGRTF